MNNFKKSQTEYFDIPGMPFSIDDLPNEILARIFGELTLSDRVECKRVCPRWRWIFENLIVVDSLLVSSYRARSVGQPNGRLCAVESHQFLDRTLTANPMAIENLALIIVDDHLEIRALKIDFDTRLELNAFGRGRVLELLERSPLVEHLELRLFTRQELDYLATVNDHLARHNGKLRHLSLKKVEYIDFLCIRNLDLFERLFDELASLTSFECDFCVVNDGQVISAHIA